MSSSQYYLYNIIIDKKYSAIILIELSLKTVVWAYLQSSFKDILGN